MFPTPARRLLVASTLAAAVLTSGCGDNTRANDGRITVVSSFAAADELVRMVGGSNVQLVQLAPPGIDPHHLELSPSDVIEVIDADVVITLGGFQTAVDEVIGEAHADRVLDLADVIELRAATEEADDAHDDHGHDDGDVHDDHDHEHGATDFHFWLDPERMQTGATAVAERLAEVDPDHAEQYRANAEQTVTALGVLDADYAQGLASCERDDIVTSHQAFGYLAARYGFHEHAIAGLSTESEPSPATLERVSDYITDNGVTTVFFETSVSPDIATTLADETGATAAVLDPLESITDDSPGTDYVSIMRSNLEALRTARGCA